MELVARATRSRIDRLVLGVTAFGSVLGLVFVWLTIDLTPRQQRAVVAVDVLMAIGLGSFGLALHRRAFRAIAARFVDAAGAGSGRAADSAALARLQRYPAWLASRLTGVAVVLLVIGLVMANASYTRFSPQQLLGVAAAGVFVTFTFGVACYFRCRWSIGPALAALIDRTGELAPATGGRITLELWLFALAVAVVPVVFLGCVLSHQAQRAIEASLLGARAERLGALAREIASEGLPLSPQAFEERMRRSAGHDGTLLLAWPTGEVIYQTSTELFVDPGTGRLRERTGGFYRLADSSLPAELIARVGTGEMAGALDIVGERLVVSQPLTKVAPDPLRAPRLWWVFPRATGALGDALSIVVALGAGVLAFVAALIAIFAQMLSGPLAQIEEASERIARGDLSKPVRVTTDGEIGALALSFRRMHENLVRLIGRVSDAAQQVGSIATQLVERAERVDGAARTQVRSVEDSVSSIASISQSIVGIRSSIAALESAAGDTETSIQAMGRSIVTVDGHVEMLSRSAESTAASIAAMAGSIREEAAASTQLQGESETTVEAMLSIDRSMQQIRERADQTHALAERVIHDAGEAQSAVARAAASIDHIVATSAAGRDAMDTLQRHIEEIDQVLRIQRSIIGGTKLLALNATIIAARAGEGAAELAVIANDIKELSIKSRERAADIERLVERIRSAGASAQQAESAGRASIEDGELRSRETGESLEKIVASAVLSTESARGIAHAAQEQARQGQYLRRAIQKVATGVAAITRATEEQRRGSERIQRATDEVRGHAQMVKQSTAEQRDGIERVVRRVATIRDTVVSVQRSTGELDRSGARVAEAVETIRAATRDSNALIEAMNRHVQQLFEQAEGLTTEVRRFRLGDGTHLGGFTTDVPSALPPFASSRPSDGNEAG